MLYIRYMSESFELPSEHSYRYSEDYNARYLRAAEVFRAVAHPSRLKIIELLEGGNISVGALEYQLLLPQPVISHHLAILRRAQLVSAQRSGTAVRYSLV